MRLRDPAAWARSAPVAAVAPPAPPARAAVPAVTAPPVAAAPAAVLYAVLYVATDLTSFAPTPAEAAALARDLEQEDADGRRRAYRRLDVSLYVWLYERLRQAKPALVAAGEWSAAEARFHVVHAFARQYFDRTAWAQGMALGTRTGYRPPRIRDMIRWKPWFAPAISPESRAFIARTSKRRQSRRAHA